MCIRDRSDCIEPQGIHNLVVAAGDVEKAGVDAKVYETVFTRYFVLSLIHI